MPKSLDQHWNPRYYIGVPEETLQQCRNPFEIGMLTVVAMIFDEFGECIASVEDLSILAMMSTGKASQVLASLTQRGQLIREPLIPPEALSSGMHDGCSYCQQPYPLLERHHIVPVGQGGQDHDGNIAHICPNCHRLAHSMKYTPYWRAQ